MPRSLSSKLCLSLKMWLKRKCLKLFWQNFVFFKHFGGKIGNGDNFLPNLGLRAGLVSAKTCLHCQFCLQNVCKTQNFVIRMTSQKFLRHFRFNHLGFSQNFNLLWCLLASHIQKNLASHSVYTCLLNSIQHC